MNERLRGVNLGGWMSQQDAIAEKDPARFRGPDHHLAHFINKSDFETVRRWGFNHVRLPLDHDLFFDNNGSPLEHRLVFLDRAVEWADANGLKLILDLHRCPGHTFDETEGVVQDLFAKEAPKALTELIWTHLANRYGHHSHLIFEILNEPVAPDAKTWNRLKDRLCGHIRQHSPRTPIIVGSNMWNWPSSFGQMTPVPAPNIIYCFHFYEPLLFTHQNAPWLPEPEFHQPWDYPGDHGHGVVRHFGMRFSDGVWDKKRLAREIEPVRAFAAKHQVPIICNEFGVYAGAPRPAQLRWIVDFLDLLKQTHIGFTYWNYKNLDFGLYSQGESLHQNLPRYQNDQRLDKELLTILQER